MLAGSCIDEPSLRLSEFCNTPEVIISTDLTNSVSENESGIRAIINCSHTM